MFPAFRSFFNAVTFNALSPAPQIFLRLRWRDPEGTVRDFPVGFPVNVRFVEGSAVRVVAGLVQADGLLTVTGRSSSPWRSFTLEFNPAYIAYIVCEPGGSPPLSPPLLVSPPGLSSISPPSQRFFSLSRAWQMGQADWSPPPVFTANGSWNSPPGKISHTVRPAADIGSAASPPTLVLDPHWKYLQFQFFDRFYGHGLMNSPPGSGHQRRVCIPQIALEGFQNDPNAAGSPPDTHSNWVIQAGPAGSPPDNTQALPWILRRQVNNSPISPVLRGSSAGIRFRTHDTLISTVFSQDETTRAWRDVSPPAMTATSPPSPLQPGPERLRYYDLPRLWKSKNYFGRGVPDSPPGSSPPPGQFFNDLNVADLALSDVKTSPLVFSLDDMVLTDRALAKLDLGATDRVAVIHHRFADRQVSPPAGAPSIAQVNTEGVYRPGADASPPGYPYSDIGLRNRHYITDYPDWTRLILAQGNLFDVFAERTPGSQPVVGARAAVRWVDATTAPNGGAPGTHLAAAPALSRQIFFAIQPFFQQNYLRHSHNPQAGPIRHDEWSSAYGADQYPIGRTDLALIRCCDRVDSDEVAVMLRYMKFNFSFVSPPMSTSPPAMQGAWAQVFVDSITKRWNGPDSIAVGVGPHVLNEQRAWILPSPPASPPFRAQISTMLQYVTTPRAHYQIVPLDVTGRSWMQAWDGTGALRRNAQPHDATSGFNGLPGRGLATAHEAGHCGTLQDEYREGESESRTWLSLHIAGNPYIHDSFGIMNNNWDVRARYFWYGVEWMRQFPGLGGTYRLHHGPGESNYFVPHYPHYAARPGRDFVTHPLRFTFRSPPAGVANFDSLLYFLGADAYSTQVLPNSGTLGGGAAMDGMLIVLVRTLFDLNRVPGTPTFQGTVRTFLFTRVTALVNGRLNFRFTSAHRSGTHDFSRCLLHFVPGFAASFASPPGATPFGSTAPAMFATNVVHLNARLSSPPSPPISPPPPRWPAAISPPFSPPLSPPVWRDSPPASGPKSVRFHVPANLDTLTNADRNTFLQALADEMFSYLCQTLGLSAASPPAPGDFQAAASYQPIVRTVMDAAAPNPVVT